MGSAVAIATRGPSAWGSTGSGAGGGGTAAPANAPYITTTSDPNLTNETTIGAIILPPDVLANRPAASGVAAGGLFFPTNETSIYRSTGSAWVSALHFAAGVATFLNNPTSANLAAALVGDNTGTGMVVFSDSPAFTGTPSTPTAAPGNNTTTIANTAFVHNEIVASGNVSGGFSAIDLGGATSTYYAPPERRFTSAQRGGTMSLAHVTAAIQTELWIGDSMGAYGASVPGTTDMISVYDRNMALAWNLIPRTRGYRPADQWTLLTGSVIKFDSVPGGLGSHSTRGPSYSNKILASGDSFTDAGDGVSATIWRTDYRSGGAVVYLSINGVGATTIAAGSNGVNTSTFAGAGTLNVASTSGMPTTGTIAIVTGGTLAVVTYTGITSTTFTGCTTLTGGGVMSTGGAVNWAIDNRDSTIGATPAYDSGRFTTYSRPNGGYGTMSITCTHSGTGTSFEVEGIHYNPSIANTGRRLIRADLPGQSLSYIADPANAPSMNQVVKNNLPSIITIVLGVNDAVASGLNHSAATVAADLTTVVGNLRAQYTAGLPAIRFVFQHTSSSSPATWATTYKSTLRTACATLGVLFLDADDEIGSSVTPDYYDISDDQLHPNDYGSNAYAELVESVTVRPLNDRALPILLNYGFAQSSSAAATTITNSGGKGMVLAQDTGAAVTSGTQLGFFAFQGAYNDKHDLAFGSGIRGFAEGGLWSGTNSGARLEFFTTPVSSLSGILVRGGFGRAGDFFVGATLGTGVFTVTSAGNTVISGTLASGALTVTGAATVSTTLGITGTTTAAAITMSGALTLSDVNMVLGTATGTKIGTATTQKLAFYNSTPIVQPSAYTQTFATADKTHAARTSNSQSEVAATNVSPYGYASAAQANAITANLNAIRADLADTAQLVNSIVDDLQALGLVA